MELFSALFGLFADPAVDEVLLNGAFALFVARAGGLTAAPSPFASEGAFLDALHVLATAQGVRLDPLAGTAGGALEGGAWRWHCVLPPLAPDGPLFSLRRHRFAALSPADFGGEPALKVRLDRAMRARAAVLIAGPTGSGKTTLLAALLAAFAQGERVVLVEALAELPLTVPGAVRLLERRPNLEGIGAFPLSRLVQEALRLRPDRLVVGEIRGHEAAAFLDAAASGHDGCMATIHARSADEALARLSLLAGARVGYGLSVTVAVLARGNPPALIDVAERSFS